MAREDRITFDSGKELGRMIQQRAKQEGIGVSEYLREAVLFEMVFSGDVEATKFVAKRFGKRLKDSLIDRLAGVDIKSQIEALTTE
jgi:hypothetical protein